MSLVRVSRCPIQLEARLVSMRSFAKDDQRMAVPACAIEVRIVRAHVEEALLDRLQGRRIDPDKWRPLIMSFRGFYGLGQSLHRSKLAKGPESAYAPWRSGGVRKMVGMVYRHWAHRQYRGDVEVPADHADVDGSRGL